jgi:hypothetical protein
LVGLAATIGWVTDRKVGAEFLPQRDDWKEIRRSDAYRHKAS